MFEKFEKLQLVWLALILAFGLIIAVQSGTLTLSKDNISVTGSAYQVVKSDSARLVVDLKSRKHTKSEAYSLIKTQLPLVIEYLKAKGLNDIEVKPINSYYVYKYNSNGTSTNEIAYYNATQSIEIKSNDVDKIKATAVDIQNLYENGIDIEVMNPEYYYSGLADLKVKLLQDATTDAKDRATAMLKATHNRPGKIQSVNMGVFQITPVDSTNVSDMGINDTTTIEKKVTAVANVVFRIK